jgi:predicted homoserine dehydrogenase-like protein
LLLKNGKSYVDYILGAQPGGGVFIVGYSDNPYQKSILSYYKMGDGPFYLFYRPYHLCHIECMETVAEAFLDKKALLQPTFGFHTNVYAYAKKDLSKGEKLDGSGGYTCYGLIENCSKNNDKSLPICLAENLTLNRNISQDEKIMISNVNYDPNSFKFRLYSEALQESYKRNSL